MRRENFIPILCVVGGVVSLILAALMAGMWIFDSGSGKDAPAETVFMACLFLMSGTWSLGTAAVLRPVSRRWQRVLYLSLYAGMTILFVCGLAVLFQVASGAAESEGSALFVAAFFLTLGAISLGIGALVQRASRAYSISGSS